MTTSLATNNKGQKYTDKLPAELTKLKAAGMSDVQVYAGWGISKDTFYRWKKEYPQFKEACDIGEGMFQKIHEDLGVAGMMKHMDIDYNFWRDLGKFRHGWSDKASGTSNTQINIDSITVLKQQTNEELIEYIRTNLKEIPEIYEGEIVESSEPE